MNPGEFKLDAGWFVDRNAIGVSAGVDWRINEHWALFADGWAQYMRRPGIVEYGAMGGIRGRF